MAQDKHLRERGASRKGIYLLPNLFTTAGLFFGFYAIVQATKGDFANAALAIFVAMIMDGLDGRVARWTNTASDFGKEYDSLVDVISFGLTPALVMYEWSLSQNGKLGWLSAFLYVAATALRLARFNTQDSPDERYFVGLPCPAAAAFAAAWVWLFDSTNTTGSTVEVMSIVVTMCLGLAMVTNIPYKSFKDWDLKGRVPFVRLIVPVLVLILVVSDPPRILFLGFLIYFLSGPAMWLIKRNRGEPIAGTDFDAAEDGDAESDAELDEPD